MSKEMSSNDALVFEVCTHFCSAPGCELKLHVRPGDIGVKGEGNWAEIEGGFWVGRQLVAGRMLCDFCAKRALDCAIQF